MDQGLRLGITGHRHVADPVAAAGAMTRLLERLNTLLGARLPGPWVAVSPLALGADRIFAEAVLARPMARLDVITPFALDDYRKDFAGPDDRESFETLLARAGRVEELGFDRAREASRLAGYRAAGERVVRRCQVLVAYWDGRPAAGVGGTGEIVEHALAVGRAVLWIDARDPGIEASVLRPGGGRVDGLAGCIRLAMNSFRLDSDASPGSSSIEVFRE